ncbi:hypothetical protein BBO99_00004572 [Phytophthora kernoviae]|uniref:C2 domain-containing protein n=2 Tax=Phytophthora kernoviae TaxID=325452 RepID=A0A3R7HJ06_9STRA|nr:hypothetical protein G195_005254 [Phytophthora kernoviae 00238/432]KAG2517292.1 hypothetical protein JM18_007805 [Phytophthora kernoviae]KAG2524918.1 hypothetical protein JM16_004604 [Phytophthora kernoviae]RLN44767.1 hypothetical protein BBI17_005038 [Phytophthora kernoviae]RLN80331.1 hypothetical protein BBO99_00004572 [Phytophthora kernoviae]
MSVSIKVSVRCRPFTCDDKLGVVLTQNGEEEGDVELINSTYSTTRFPFSYAWWSAYGYKRHIQGDPLPADNMTLVDQQMAYQSVGMKIKSDLLGGNAVVLFAYGLSGSGKTFTVFGWGIFPRLAYELFKEKQDGWKISMKYFQNVVDTVRDLMSPVAQEQQYKSGMRKDADGFTDIEWCQSVVLKDWNDLRRTFMIANAKKAIAPTQFNHQSTRGHCIMTLEVEKPDPEREGMKQRGRVYVCDLAGTEPAGDIMYAEYKKVVFENGEIEHKFLGPHPDASKSKELQDQGKKINLSLTEMAQFFMKMAEAVKANKLKPGMSIPGCNSYFLCKYLKDTMLQARTYLFCAIRPEVKFHGYTFSTLGFAKNASVIKLQPKKASTAASPAERKLMAELEQMKALVNQLKDENERIAKIRNDSGVTEAAATAGAETVSDAASAQVTQLSKMLNQKQKELENVLNGGSGGASGGMSVQDEMMQRQREEYGKRGIHLYHFEADTTSPYLINLDVDAYRSKRFMFLLDKPHLTVGPQGNIQPISLSIVNGHCSFENDGSEISLLAGAGDVMRNGKKLEKNERAQLAPFDRVVLGNELMLFVYPGREPDGEPPTADSAAAEYKEALQTVDSAAMNELQEQMKKFEEEKARWEKERQERETAVAAAAAAATAAANADSVADKAAAEAAAAAAAAAAAQAEEEARLAAEKQRELLARQVNDQELREVLPKIAELTQIVKFLNRDVLSFETALQSSSMEDKEGNGMGGIPKVKVKVYNKATDETIFLDVFEFVKAHALLKDEVAFLRNALMNNREYESPAGHDPITLLFDNAFHIGSATTFLEYLLYNLETEPDESQLSIKLAVPPFNSIGKLQVIWVPLSSPDPEKHNEDDLMDVESPSDLLGKPWTFKLRIVGATGLPIITDLAYCQYEFLGELFTTESVEQNTRSPVFNYEFIHHVDCVTEQFIEYLQSARLEFQVFVNPYILDPPKDKISTSNPAIAAQLGEGHAAKPTYDELQEKCLQLEKSLASATEELAFLKEQYRTAFDLALRQKHRIGMEEDHKAAVLNAGLNGSTRSKSLTRVHLNEVQVEVGVDPPARRQTVSTPSATSATSSVKASISTGAPLKVLIASWNVGNTMPPKYSKLLDEWIPEGGGDFDVIAIGLQESTYKSKEKDSENLVKTDSHTSSSRKVGDDDVDPTGSEIDFVYIDEGGDDEDEDDEEEDKSELRTDDSEDKVSSRTTSQKNLSSTDESSNASNEAIKTGRGVAPLSSLASEPGEIGTNKSSDVIVKRSRTKKSMRKVTRMVRQLSSNLRDTMGDGLDYPFNRQIYMHLGESYALVGKVDLMEMRLFVYVHERNNVTDVEKLAIPTGLGSVIGNKGGLLFKCVIENTSLCFASCHLAAHQDQKFLDKRNSDCATILGTHFGQKNVTIDHQFDHCFWFGDLNYRVDLSYTAPRKRNHEKHCAEVMTLLERVPSYCDRVLYKSLPGLRDNLKLQCFSCIESIATSDHKPVAATFQVVRTPPIGVCSVDKTTLVEITELAGSKLLGLDLAGSSDPYVKFYSVPSHAVQVDTSGSHPTTSMIPKTCSPKWRDDQVPKLHILYDHERDVKRVHLTLVIMDYDATSKDDLMGVSSLSLEKYCLDRPRFLPFEVPVVLHGKAAGTVTGKIRVTLPHQTALCEQDAGQNLIRVAGCHCTLS